jgi:hypothetical protein
MRRRLRETPAGIARHRPQTSAIASPGDVDDLTAAILRAAATRLDGGRTSTSSM